MEPLHPNPPGLKSGEGDLVEELMVRCLDGPEEDWPRALEEAAQEHPELAEELNLRLDALVAVDHRAEKDDASAAPHERFVAPDQLGEFTRLEPLGSGGMGLVFRAYQESLDRVVALKIIRPERLFFETSLTRFQREVETVARLHHPGIVAIHSVGRAAGSELPYFAMELLRGTTLSGIIAHVHRRAPESLEGRDMLEAVVTGPRGSDSVADEVEVPPELSGSWTDAAVWVVLQVGRALQHAHGEGVLHRDVKPSNIMLEPGGRAVLFDFGLTATDSTARDRVTQTGQPVGTLVYMSPEQIEGDLDLDARADVYSLGVTLYELLTLQAPFAGATSPRIQTAVLSGDVDPLRVRNRRVPAELQTVVLKAMALRRGDRYADARSFCADLENILARRPVDARSPGGLVRALRWIRRRPSTAVAIALGLCLLVGVPLVLLFLSQRHADEMAAIAEDESAAKQAALEANAELEDVVAFTLGMFQRARPDWNGGQVPDAREMLRLGAAELPELRDHPASEARIELTLGELFSTLADARSAGPHLDAAIDYYGQREDRESRARLARALRHSGHGLLYRREFPLAKERLVRALKVAGSVFGDDHPELHPYHATLADLYRDLGEFEAAVAERKRALELLADADPDDPRRARTRGLLGVTLKDAGRLVEARPLLEEAIAWNDGRVDGQKGLDSQGPLFLLTLGDLEKLEGNLDKALDLAQRARAVLGATRGPEDLMTAQARMAEAEALARLGRHAEALPSFSALGERLAHDLPPSHPAVLRTRLMEIACLVALNRRSEVAPLCREHELVRHYIETFGDTHPNTRRVLRALALSLQEREENAESLAALRQLEAAERGAEPWSADHADSIFMLVSHRMKIRASDEENGPAATAALLQELLAAVEGQGVHAVSAISGQTYDVEATARGFLGALTGGR